jgi:hypothetical protein
MSVPLSGKIRIMNGERSRYARPSTCGSADGRCRSALAYRCARSIRIYLPNAGASPITYRTLDVGLRKSTPGASSVSLGHGVYTDLRTNRELHTIGGMRDGEQRTRRTHPHVPCADEGCRRVRARACPCQPQSRCFYTQSAQATADRYDHPAVITTGTKSSSAQKSGGHRVERCGRTYDNG